MGSACFGPKPQKGKIPMNLQDPVMGHGRGAVRPYHPGDCRTRIPADGRVNGPLICPRPSDADSPVFPLEIRGMEASAEQVVDIAAFGNDHQTGGALVQTADGMKDKFRASRPGQRPGNSRGIRQEIGGMGGHSGRLIDHQQMLVLPENGQGPGTGGNDGRGRTVVSGLNVQPVAGPEDEGGMHRLSVDQDAVRDPDQAGDGMGGEVEPRPQDMTDSSPRVFRRNNIRNDSITFHNKQKAEGGREQGKGTKRQKTKENRTKRQKNRRQKGTKRQKTERNKGKETKAKGNRTKGRIIQPGIFSGRGPAARGSPVRAGRKSRYHDEACP